VAAQVVTSPSRAKSTPYTTTFRICRETPELVQEYTEAGSNETSANWVLHLGIYQPAEFGEIVQFTPFPEAFIIATTNGFVNAVMRASNFHYTLVLRPDDLWLSIMTQFSFYLNAHPELKSLIVNFEESGELTLSALGMTPI